MQVPEANLWHKPSGKAFAEAGHYADRQADPVRSISGRDTAYERNSDGVHACEDGAVCGLCGHWFEEPFSNGLPSEAIGLNTVQVRITGQVDGTRRPGLISLVDLLTKSGFNDFVVFVEDISSADSSGVVALSEMLLGFKANGSRARFA